MGTAYSLADTTITVGGSVIQGFGDGDAIEVSRTADDWEHVTNADGSKVNCAILDKSAMITLRLRYNSTANNHLNTLRDDQEYFEFTCEWPNGDIIESGETLVHKPPEIKDGQKVSNREWQLFCNTLSDTFSAGGA